MNRLVVDASVVIKWYVPEVHSAEAVRLLEEEWVLVAPDLLGAEVANTLWKKVRRGEISERDASDILAAFLASPVEIFPSTPLLPGALDIAMTLGRTVNDSLYLALAVERYAAVITADENLANAVKESPLAGHVQWIAQRTD